jgi:diacylglycerol kinase (ATP)
MFADRRVLVVLNPSSGRGRADEAERAIRLALDEAGAIAEIRRTGGVDDAHDWAAGAAAEGFDFVLAAGGDGTVTAVAHGLLQSDSPIPLGVVPMGTGNGLARVLLLPMDTASTVAALALGTVSALDVVEVVQPVRSTALLFLGAGLDADINRDADARAKARFGFLAYVGATARNLVRLRPHRVTIVLDGVRHEVRAHTVSMFNAGRLVLSGVPIGPDTDPHDGLLDVAVLRSSNFWRALSGVVRLVTRAGSRALLDRAHEVRIDAHPPLPVHLDGDVVGTTPLVARVRRRALPVIVAENYAALHLAANEEAAAAEEAEDQDAPAGGKALPEAPAA